MIAVQESDFAFKVVELSGFKQVGVTAVRLDQIRQIAEAVPGVDSVEKCLVRKVGYHYFVDMHVEVDPQMTVERSHHIAHEVKDNIRSRLPAVRDVLVHIEPARGMAKSE